MDYLHSLGNILLIEQDSKLSVLRKAIGERLPISIYYKGPPDEVREGQRIDIEPIVLGKNSRSSNLVIWAYVFKGVSKKGLPGWKMFRVDRIVSAKFNPNAERFKLGDLPGYVKGKAPSMMKSLSDVEIFSPYWFDDKNKYKEEPPPTEVPKPAQPVIPPKPEQPIISQPPATGEYHPNNLATKVYGELTPQIQNNNGQKSISKLNYDMALKNLSGYQEDQWKNRQRLIGMNTRPGQGTRKRFDDTSKFELDRLLAKDNVKVADDNEMLAEAHRMQSRFKRLINW